ncbi:fibroblast growth factor receptor-like 1 isoform X1 [Stylophora pistillata]|uniref:fibroblast growth factor receptor-like 1 isoform X1 n=1 Tax=Stylophora pistillata TaxID=50429 RepID=UPI000C03A1B6|nr:fibroblast growth factor receptor-like 1 isoform X1 [Stylophora pistillata]XP_022806019.1 fibroblast growth factor receptor-like 1 isoform X1 [Stylophora pistillata]
MLLTSLLFKTILVAFLGSLDNHHTEACSVPYIREKSGNKARVIKVNSERDVKLMCQIRSTVQIPEPGYYWLKDNQTLTPSDHQGMRLRPYRYLKIRRVKKEDAGFYTCVVVNDCGKNRYTMQLFVGARRLKEKITAAPKFTVPQYKMRRNLLAAPVGNSVMLDCSANGNPRPTVEWYKDEKLFKERKGGSKLYVSQWTTLLSLTDLVPSDTGSYMCNVSNLYGWINHTYKVDVHERARAEPVVLPMENVTVNRGENASLTCKALSDSMPHFQWLRWFPMLTNGSVNSSVDDSIESLHYEILNEDVTDQHVIVPPSNNKKFEFHGVKLTLLNVTKKEEGKYSCLVGNAVGYVVEHAYIIVQNIDEAKPTELQKTESTTDGKRNREKQI